jgi:hypothetical protein
MVVGGSMPGARDHSSGHTALSGAGLPRAKILLEAHHLLLVGLQFPVKARRLFG